MKLQLQISVDQLRQEAAHYPAKYRDKEVADIIPLGQQARDDGYLSRNAFIKLASWKSPRPLHWYEANSAADIEEASRKALSASDTWTSVNSLITLKGVQLRVASALLHLCHREPYPLLDLYALYAVGQDWGEQQWRRRAYERDVWDAYVPYCRQLSDQTGLSMRELDRGLWTYGEAERKKADTSRHCR